MALSAFFNRVYSVESDKPVADILIDLKNRIDKAKKENSLFNFDEINYKRFIFHDHTLIIRRKRSMFAPYRGTGIIKIKFGNFGNRSIGTANLYPGAPGLEGTIWVAFAFLLFFTTVVLWRGPGFAGYIMVIIAWIIIIGNVYIGATFQRYGLKRFLKGLLMDLGVNDELVEIKK